jgi:bacterioferritin-associated ferredoxin
MVVCHCRVVNDRAIRAAIASGARTVAEVARHCGAGRGCGGCCPAVRRILAEHRATPGTSSDEPGTAV